MQTKQIFIPSLNLHFPSVEVKVFPLGINNVFFKEKKNAEFS